MKRHKDALKAARQAVKRHARNKSTIERIKTLRKNVATATGPEEIEKALRTATSAVMSAERKGILHRNTSSRIVSRMTKSSNAKAKKKA
jgi:small subunit ribosomal protein S20